MRRVPSGPRGQPSASMSATDIGRASVMSVTDIDGKIIAITGASSGIGAATAELLAARGAQVVLGARREAPLRALAERIGDAGPPWRVTDVRRREDVAALVALARERHGRLDVLINNAGVGPISRLDALRVEDWDDMIDINLKGALHGIAAALPVFRRPESGHMVFTSSTAAHRIVPTMAVYAGDQDRGQRRLPRACARRPARACASRSSRRATCDELRRLGHRPRDPGADRQGRRGHRHPAGGRRAGDRLRDRAARRGRRRRDHRAPDGPALSAAVRPARPRARRSR